MLPEYPRPSGSPLRRPADRGLLALLVLQAGATTVVLAALPYQLFQLDRYTLIKELVLLMAGTTAALLCLAGAKRLTIFLVDALLAGYLGLSLVSALAASQRVGGQPLEPRGRLAHLRDERHQRTHPGDPRLRRPVLPAGARGGARGRDPWRQARHARRCRP